MSTDSTINFPRNPLPTPTRPDMGEPRFTLAIGSASYADFARRAKAVFVCMWRYARHPDQPPKQGIRRWPRVRTWLIRVLTWLIIAFVLFWGFRLVDRTGAVAYVWFGHRSIILDGLDLATLLFFLVGLNGVVLLGVALIWARLYRRALYTLADNTEILIIGEHGIQIVRDTFTAGVPWHGIGQIVERRGLTVIIGHRLTYAVSIPDAAFTDAAQRAQCLQFIGEQMMAAQRRGAETA